MPWRAARLFLFPFRLVFFSALAIFICVTTDHPIDWQAKAIMHFQPQIVIFVEANNFCISNFSYIYFR